MKSQRTSCVTNYFRMVFMGGNKESSTQFSANKVSINSDIDNIVKRFWDLES